MSSFCVIVGLFCGKIEKKYDEERQVWLDFLWRRKN